MGTPNHAPTTRAPPTSGPTSGASFWMLFQSEVSTSIVDCVCFTTSPTFFSCSTTRPASPRAYERSKLLDSVPERGALLDGCVGLLQDVTDILQLVDDAVGVDPIRLGGLQCSPTDVCAPMALSTGSPPCPSAECNSVNTSRSWFASIFVSDTFGPTTRACAHLPMAIP